MSTIQNEIETKFTYKSANSMLGLLNKAIGNAPYIGDFQTLWYLIKKKAVIFDIDGTLTEFGDTELLPGRLNTIKVLQSLGIKVILCTNQGGPACRAVGWRKRDGSTYPSVADVENRCHKIADSVKADKLYISLFYQSQGIPTGIIPTGVPLDDLRLDSSWRKPNGGMFAQAMSDFSLNAGDCVTIGDRITDKEASEDANMDFFYVNTVWPTSRT